MKNDERKIREEEGQEAEIDATEQEARREGKNVRLATGLRAGDAWNGNAVALW